MSNAQKTQPKKPAQRPDPQQVCRTFDSVSKELISSIQRVRASAQPRSSSETTSSLRTSRTIPSQRGPRRTVGLLVRAQGTAPSSTNDIPRNGTIASRNRRPVLTFRDPDGNVISTSLFHSSLNSFSNSAPVTQSGGWVGRRADELGYVRNDGFADRIRGEEFIGTVSSYVSGTTGNSYPGDRLLHVCVNPGSFGGRLALLTKMFEQNKVRNMRFTYVPSCPTTTSGSLAMLFSNAVDEPMVSRGMQAMTSYSAGQYFKPFSVWQETSMDVVPSDLIRRYEDDNGDARFTTQGLFTVLNCSLNTGTVTFGNVFLHYEYDFFTPVLSQTVAAPPSMSLVWTAGATTITTEDATMFANTTATTAPLANISITGSASPFDYIWYGPITLSGATVGVLPPIHLAADSSVTSIQAGQVHYFRVLDLVGTTQMNVFPTLEAAAQGNFSGYGGSWLYTTTTAAGVNQYSFSANLRGFPLDQFA